MARPTNREILGNNRDTMVSGSAWSKMTAQPTICYYYKLQKSIASETAFRQTLDLEATQKGLIQQYRASLETLERENSVIQDWLTYLDATPRLRLTLHNNQKTDLIRQLRILLDLDNFKPKSNPNPTLVNFLDDFSISDVDNLMVFAKNRQAERSLEASLEFLKKMQINPEISPTVSIAHQAKIAEQMALQYCARCSNDANMEDPNKLKNYKKV